MVQSSEVQQATRQARASRIYLLLAFCAFILIGCNDGTLGVLIPSIQAYYQIDTVTISWLFFASTIGYLSASFNNGFLTEKLGERRFLLLGVTTFIVGVGLYSLRPPFALFLCSGVMLGAGTGMVDAGLNAYIASLPNNVRPLNFLHAFYGIGALLGPLVASGLLTLDLGWQATYMVWLAVALLILLSFWFAFKRREPVVKQASGGQGGNLLSATLRLRVVWLAALFLLFYVGTEVGLGNWSYSFLTLSRSGPVLFSAWVVSGYWCGLTLGRLVLANFAPRLGVRRLITLCLAGVMFGLILAWGLPGVWGAAIGLCLVGFSLGPLFPTAIALMPQLVSARLLPSAIGFLACLGSAGGALFPWLAGNIVQHAGYWSLLPFALVLTVGMAGLWAALNRQAIAQEE